MSYEKLPGGIPERRFEPRDDEETGLELRRPPLPSCPCGRIANVFPRPGERYCGFCEASKAALGGSK